MSKLKEHLTEAISNPILDAWEESYLSIKKIKDELGNEISLSFGDIDEISKQHNELMKIIVGLEKYYVQNTKKVASLSKKIK